MKKLFLYLLGVPKSLIVNFRLCSFKDAIKLPIVVSSNTKLSALSGSVSFSKIRPGIVRIGFGSVETYDYRYNRTLLSIKGHIHFQGKTKIGFGSKLSVAGELQLGENFHISAASTIVCRKKIVIGKNTLMAWDSLITDSDLHPIYDFQDNRINKDESVVIGDHCWIGAKASILKGAEIANNTVIALGSVVTCKESEEYCVLAGNPAKIVKKGVVWKE